MQFRSILALAFAAAVSAQTDGGGEIASSVTDITSDATSFAYSATGTVTSSVGSELISSISSLQSSASSELASINSSISVATSTSSDSAAFSSQSSLLGNVTSSIGSLTSSAGSVTRSNVISVTRTTTDATGRPSTTVDVSMSTGAAAAKIGAVAMGALFGGAAVLGALSANTVRWSCS
ncbi:hypothetical protein B0O99DRAFT_337551 [Bisporella sp. PMI_857]|nr:hypothetical protein B0O99DRAFT_337551 [Bisporella sp. PMI_857]